MSSNGQDQFNQASSWYVIFNQSLIIGLKGQLCLGLRCLTVKAACLDLNFYVRDIQAMVATHLPTLPTSEENLSWKNLVCIFNAHLNEKELKLISEINYISAKHIG